MTDTLTPGPAPGSPAAVAAEVDLSAYDPRRWWTLAVLCLSLLIVFVGNSSLNVAIPTLSRDLHATESQLQWVVAVYSLVFAGLLFTTGALGDRFGRKGALQLGLVLFLVGRLARHAVDAMWQLIACRAVMGVGAALDHAVDAVDPRQRLPAARAHQGHRHLGQRHRRGRRHRPGRQRLAARPLLVRLGVPRQRARSSSSPWSPGTFLVPEVAGPRAGAASTRSARVLSIIGIVALVYGLIEAPEQGLGAAPRRSPPSPSAPSCSPLFVLWELRVDEPMLDIRYFRNPAFSTGTGGMILVFLAMYGVMFLITQYFQLVLGYSAARRGACASCRWRRS